MILLLKNQTGKPKSIIRFRYYHFNYWWIFFGFNQQLKPKLSTYFKEVHFLFLVEINQNSNRRKPTRKNPKNQNSGLFSIIIISLKNDFFSSIISFHLAIVKLLVFIIIIRTEKKNPTQKLLTTLLFFSLFLFFLCILFIRYVVIQNMSIIIIFFSV